MLFGLKITGFTAVAVAARNEREDGRVFRGDSYPLNLRIHLFHCWSHVILTLSVKFNPYLRLNTLAG